MLSAGVPEVFASGDWTVMTLGYAIMRVSLTAQWLRAARSSRSGSGRAARRHAVGISTAMLGWGALLVVPPALRTPGLFVMVAVELAVPVWAERAGRTPWHPAHLAERHGLFTIIVLGESVLAGTLAVQSVVDGEDATSAVIGTILGAPLVVFAMWWIYFSEPGGSSAPDLALTWAYGPLPDLRRRGGRRRRDRCRRRRDHRARLRRAGRRSLRCHCPVSRVPPRRLGAALAGAPSGRRSRARLPRGLGSGARRHLAPGACARLRSRADRARRRPDAPDRPHSAEAVRRGRGVRGHPGTARLSREHAAFSRGLRSRAGGVPPTASRGLSQPDGVRSRMSTPLGRQGRLAAAVRSGDDAPVADET